MVAPEWVVQQPHSAREWRATNRTHGIFRGRHFEAALIVQAVSWYLRYPLSYRDIEELFLEHGLEVDHSSLNGPVANFFRALGGLRENAARSSFWLYA